MGDGVSATDHRVEACDVVVVSRGFYSHVKSLMYVEDELRRAGFARVLGL